VARIRTIKPEFFTSLTIADLTPEQRLTFIGLWTNVDDEGRCVDDPRLIKAAIWPLDDRTAADIEDDLRALTESSLITRYVFKQKRYMVVNGWQEHQKINRPTASKLPGPEQGEIPPPEPPACGDESSLRTHARLTEDSLAERKGKEQGTGKGREVSGTASRPPDITPRPDVDRLCDHLADRIEGNGSKRPEITRKWRDAARLMLDRDELAEDQIHKAIDWCQADDFWHRNILSMPKLREKYEQLRLAAKPSRTSKPAAHQHHESKAGEQLAEVFG